MSKLPRDHSLILMTYGEEYITGFYRYGSVEVYETTVPYQVYLQSLKSVGRQRITPFDWGKIKWVYIDE